MLRPEMHGAICWSTFDVARRRSELSATYTRTKLLIASTLFAALCVTTPLIAAPAGGVGQPSVVTPMTRDDVERILREAKSAIAKGDLDAAEKLVTRAENARIT